jgi:hypothetical protein
VTSGILDQIDGALRDFDTSGDAMRWWVPEGERRPWPDAVAPVAGTIDTEEFTRALNELGAAITRAFRPVIEDTVRQFHALSAVLFPSQHRRCVTCHPGRKPKPLAVDGHEYQRRLAARRRRKRGRRTRM